MSGKKLIKLGELDLNKPQYIEVGERTSMFINNIFFERGLLTKVEINKHKYEEENIFIKIYIGHQNVATIVTQNDYVIYTTSRGEDIDYSIRPAENFDY